MNISIHPQDRHPMRAISCEMQVVERGEHTQRSGWWYAVYSQKPHLLFLFSRIHVRVIGSTAYQLV